MTLLVNGESRQVAEGTTLGSLLSEMKLVPEQVATMVNGEVISRDTRDGVILKDQDIIEILTLAAGG